MRHTPFNTRDHTTTLGEHMNTHTILKSTEVDIVTYYGGKQRYSGGEFTARPCVCKRCWNSGDTGRLHLYEPKWGIVIKHVNPIDVTPVVRPDADLENPMSHNPVEPNHTPEAVTAVIAELEWIISDARFHDAKGDFRATELLQRLGELKRSTQEHR